MKKVFIDTNVLIDLLADRKPFSKFAIEIFAKAERKKVKLYTSSHTFATTHDLLKKYLNEAELRDVLYSLLAFVNLVGIDSDIIKKALKSKHKDFEDAIQIIAANTVPELDFITTRNLRDFKDAGIAVLSTDELVKQI
jgi:predicted nucleic acid-binding protein